MLRVGPNELDLLRFERLVSEAARAAPDAASELLREALALWRGSPLADVADEPFAQTEIPRLDELRVRALELRLEADLGRGRHADVVGETEALVREHPLRERPRAVLMRALYGAGRHAEALEAYRDARRTFVEELGIDPSPALQELERAMLRHDPELAPPGEVAASSAPGPIVAVVRDERRADDLLEIAAPLTRERERQLILVRLLRDSDDLAEQQTDLAKRREALATGGVSARVAAYTSADPGEEAARLATEQAADFVLVDAPSQILETGVLEPDVEAILSQTPCDVGILLPGGQRPGSDRLSRRSAVPNTTGRRSR